MDNLKWIKFKEGYLKNISIYTTEEYSYNYKNGDTDPEMMSDIKKNIKEDTVIFDVGTFIGTTSLVFSKLLKKNGKVVSFEPNPYNYEKVTKNFKKNSDLSKKSSYILMHYQMRPVKRQCFCLALLKDQALLQELEVLIQK